MVTTLNKNICHFSHYWEYSFWFVLAAISWWNIADTSEGNGEIEFCQIANPDFCLRQVSAAVSVPVSIVVRASPAVWKTMSKSAGKSFFLYHPNISISCYTCSQILYGIDSIQKCRFVKMGQFFLTFRLINLVLIMAVFKKVCVKVLSQCSD